MTGQHRSPQPKKSAPLVHAAGAAPGARRVQQRHGAAGVGVRDGQAQRVGGIGARGGGLDNAIVMDDTKVLNVDGLRYAEEFAKHKILDAIGDLYCVGQPMLAAYSAFRSGHALNNQLLRALLAREDAYEIVSFEDEKKAPAGFAQLVRAW